MRKINQTTNILFLVAIAFFAKSILDKQAILALVGVFILVLAFFRRLVIKQSIATDLNEQATSDDLVMRYLQEDPVLYVEMIVSYERGNCEVLYEQNDSVLLYDHTSECYLASAKTVAGARDIIFKLPQDFGHLIVHDDIFLTVEKEIPAYHEKLLFYNYQYTQKGSYKLPTNTIELRNVEEKDLAFVKQQYRVKALCSDEYLIKRIKAGMLGAYVEGELIGFIGKHDNGAIGMLEVKEEYRKKHIGQLLEMAYVNQLIEEKEKYIYTQVENNNTASHNLQQKLLFTKAKTPTYWYFN